jgi:hypothetical protein
MTDARWLYPPELAGALTAFGLAPAPGTPPAVVRDQLNDLYRFELRRLRGRLLASEFTRPEYLERVIAMRKQYWPLTLPLAAWEKICAPATESE